MGYVISFNDDTGRFVMDGLEEKFIGDHLIVIAARENLVSQVKKATFESEALAILRANGVEIELVDIDW